ncbi:inactive serine/threonine-protein kinase TEX14 isoform D [Patagioenas fasciata monilis]|uniref:Inactive serine/threonine-protein kinase TEX14 isoform D n=1 Tax=Patagioenas fasciata monilis TaxID=372326 RepID=A0A1V4K220_PATFA|nr:inactive serine/threonine-protein kinase TEX14 isoform D [Patagioenas fasciata monilis]
MAVAEAAAPRRETVILPGFVEERRWLMRCLFQFPAQSSLEVSKATLWKLNCMSVFVDAVNSMGQTSLFTAALLGLGKIVDVLLDYGSDANHRCHDGSTPVHAAAFSGNQWILSKLLDEGGDLRVHDKDGRNPQCWAMSAGKESSAQMLEFIQRCVVHMQAALQNFPADLLRKAGSTKALVCSPSRFGGLVQGNADSPLGRFLKGGANAAKNIYSFGFGKFYLAGSGHPGYLASLPIIGEKDVVQADDEPTFSYHVGPYMMMTNLMWGGSRVTVKELSFEPHQNCSKLRLADLLIAEQEHSSKLRHPHLLQLMSVCLSRDLEKTRLVYERVNFGSLYSILHERRTEFPVLHMETILHVLLQISDALRFLHSRGFIHRSLTSYAIQIVSSGEAKLCNLEYMIESKDHGEHSDLTRIPVPVQLYKWCSPEVILEKVVTVKSDIYSFCTVVQEALTETPPWKGLEDSSIEQLIISGQRLETDVRLPMPYYNIVNSGLEPKQKNRSVKLQDIQYILKNDLKDLTKFQTGHTDGLSKAQGPTVFADVNICLTSAFSYRKRTQELQGEEITKADSPAAPRHSIFPEENSAVVDHEAPTSPQPVAQDKSPDVASELPATLSVSDVDDSLCSFEINEIFASYPELHKDFLEEGAGLGETLKNEKGQRKEDDEAALRDPCASPGLHGEEKPLDEEGEFLVSGTEYATEEEERISDTSDLCTLAQAIGPPSSGYIPPLVTCQAQGTLRADSFQADSKAAKEMEAIKNEKWKCFHEMRTSHNENNHHDLSFSVVKSLDDQVGLDHEHLLPRISGRCKKKFNLQCQRGGDSHSAASGSEEEKWCCPKSRSEIYSTKISEEGRLMQSEWRTEVKQMARRVASGQLELSFPYPAGECTSESEAESIKETYQHVKVQKSQHQQSYRWQTGDNVELWDLGSEDISEYEESDLESAFRSPGGRSCQSPSQDEQTESGIVIHENSVFPQQVDNPSRTMNAQGKLEEAFEGFVQKQFPEDAGSGVQGSGGKMLFCGTTAQNSGNNTQGVNQLIHVPVASGGAAQEGILWEPRGDHEEKDVSVTDIQDLSSIPYEQENYYRDPDCRTPRVSRTPSVSTPLSSEGKIPIAFEKCKHLHEVASDYSFCGSPELSSAASRTFATAYEEERNTEMPSASGVCSSELKKPEGLPVVASTLRSTRKASALSQASKHCTDELPPPAQELLDEIVPDQMQMEDRESKKESEGNEKRNESLWTKESFHLAEETERAHSTLDDVLERMLHSVPGDEEIQEQPQGHTLGAASLRDPEDAGRKKGVEEGGAGARGGAPESCAGSSEDRHPEDQKFHVQKQLASSSPFRIIVLDQSSPA